jgi:hypothetical protein
MAKLKRLKCPKFLPSYNAVIDPGDLDLGFGWELDYFEFLRKQDGGTPLLDAFRLTYHGKKTVGRVRRFYGRAEICSSTLSTWDFLPRGALPIGDIDIDGYEFDTPTLLTFRWGPYFNKILLFDNPHDVGPLDPDDPARLIRLANSLPVFLDSLKNHSDLFYRTIFSLAGNPEELLPLMEALQDAGAEEFEDSYFNPRKTCTSWSSLWEEFNAQITVAHDVKSIDDVALPPAAIGKGRCVLAVDAASWEHPAVKRAIKNSLKHVRAFKGAKLAGQTAAGSEPYWRKS